MICVDIGSVRFNYRVGGVCIDDGQVLLNRNPGDDWYYLPGGRCEPMEPSPETLRRELREELDVEIRLGGLLWVAENFFRMNGQDWHELCFYFRFSLPAGHPYRDKTQTYEQVESADGQTLIYRWIPLAELASTTVQPAFLTERLAHLPSSPEHIVYLDGKGELT